MVIYANILSSGLMGKNIAFYAMLGRILCPTADPSSLWKNTAIQAR